MRFRINLSLKFWVTALVVVLFLIRGLQLYIRVNRPDHRVELQGLITRQPFEQDSSGMYLKKIETRIKMENFELIEMINETSPNAISDDAILVLSASHSPVEHTYAHLLEKIQKANKGPNHIPFYLLRKARSLLMQDSHQLKNQIHEIVAVLEYFNEFLVIKRLTIISFEEGSLLTLRALAIIKYDVFSIVDKLLLINPLNPTIMILHSNSASFLQETKEIILWDPVRTQLVNGTRIVIIHTVGDNNYGHHRINWLFHNSKGGLATFANTIIVQAKLMWSVYSYLKPDEYFRYEPFNEVLARLFLDDRDHGPLPVQAIYNFLMFREPITRKELSLAARNKIIARCVDFYMETHSRDGCTFTDECTRVLRKEDFYFNEDTTVLLTSPDRFEVYGENYQKIIPYDTRARETIYLLENVQEWRRFFIINKKKHRISMMVSPVIRPSFIRNAWMNNATQLVASREAIAVRYFPVSICPGVTFLHPSGVVSSVLDTYSLLASGLFMYEYTDCFVGLDSYLVFIRNVLKNWNFGYNLIVFSLFCLHIVKRSTFSRFYYQLIINYTLTFVHTGESLLSENLVIISLVVLIELGLALTTKVAEMIYMPKTLPTKIVWIPMVFEIMRWLNVSLFLSPWKALGLLFLAATNKHNVVVLFLELFYIMEFVAKDISDPQGLFLCCAWLSLTSVEDPTPPKPQTQTHHDILIITTGRRIKFIKMKIITLRRQIVDTLTTCVIAMCLSEGGFVLHFVIDFYIMAVIIFAVHQHLDESM